MDDLCAIIYTIIITRRINTGNDGSVVKISANRPVGSEFASWYRLQPRAGI